MTYVQLDRRKWAAWVSGPLVTYKLGI